jgi:hypothetical protein
MTRPDRDYDEILSRELHSMLDPIEPAGDGLMRIRQRIAEPWLKRKLSLLRAEFAALGWLIVVRCEPLFSRVRTGFAARSPSWLRSVAAAFGLTAWVSSRRRDAARHRWREDAEPQGWFGRTMVWLRPTLAVAAAVIIVVAGIFALIQAQTRSVTPEDNPSYSAAHHPHGHHPRAGAPAGSTSGAQTAAHQPKGKPSTHKSASTSSKQGGKTVGSSPTCPPTPTPSASPSPSPSPTSPSPSPTATPTATPTTSSPGTPPTTPAKTTTPSCSSSAT